MAYAIIFDEPEAKKFHGKQTSGTGMLSNKLLAVTELDSDTWGAELKCSRGKKLTRATAYAPRFTL
jgi:hypothetical protein